MIVVLYILIGVMMFSIFRPDYLFDDVDFICGFLTVLMVLFWPVVLAYNIGSGIRRRFIKKAK